MHHAPDLRDPWRWTNPARRPSRLHRHRVLSCSFGLRYACGWYVGGRGCVRFRGGSFENAVWLGCRRVPAVLALTVICARNLRLEALRARANRVSHDGARSTSQGCAAPREAGGTQGEADLAVFLLTVRLLARTALVMPPPLVVYFGSEGVRVPREHLVDGLPRGRTGSRGSGGQGRGAPFPGLRDAPGRSDS